MVMLIRQNLGYKILALLAAIILWFYVTGEQIASTSAPIPVKLGIRNLPHGVQVVSIPETVMVTLPKGTTLSSFKNGIHAYADLSDSQRGNNLVVVQLDPATHNGTSLSVTPASVPVILDKIGSRRMTVNCQPEGTAPAGYRFEVSGIDPSTAVVSGFSNSLDKVASLQVLVNADRRYDLDGWYSVKALDSSRHVVPDVTIKPEVVRVSLTTHQVASSKEVLISPDLSGSPSPEYSVTDVSVSPTEILVSGSPDALAKVGTIRTEKLDLTGATDTLKQTLHLIIPSGLSLRGSNHAEITVRVEKRPTEQ